jgi:leader peptidase (prepilin peptidase)/N-methyltransferase
MEDWTFGLAEIREPWPPLWLMETSARILLGAWLFAFGASVGSFINVVVYRLPRRLSLAYPGSRCPACGHAIRGRDNLPVLSWLLLRGKCRDCGAPISPRYYYVELFLGLLFLLIAVFEAFLPQSRWIGSEFIRPPPGRFDAFPIWSAYAVHVVLLASLVAAALIDFDGWRMPRLLLVPAVFTALVVGALWPETRRIAALPGLTGPPWQTGLIDGVAGMAAGIAAGALWGIAWLGGSRGRSWPRSAPIMLLASVGAALGWQRALIIAALAAALFAFLVVVVRLARGQGVAPPAGVVAILTGWIASEWAGPLMPLVLALSNDPVTGVGIAALATFAGVMIAGAAATSDYHAIQTATPADRFPDQQSAVSRAPPPPSPLPSPAPASLSTAEPPPP